MLVLCGQGFSALAVDATPVTVCSNPVYLTVDPGNMEYAPRIAEVLRRQQAHVTFWVSNQDTKNGEGSLGNQWATWWKLVADQGHEFASQTYDHVYWRSDLPGYKTAFRMKPTSGAYAGREFTFDPPKYCEQVAHAARRIEDFSGKKSLPLFHAPGGNTSPRLLAAASACGFAHVAITRAGLMGNGALLKSAIAEVRPGDVLLANLNAASGTEPWALGNLEPLIVGLKARGLCFDSLRRHPAYVDWIGSHGG
jgi:peptidoglycan/xylan/chitin deacetylase (PgdA/CDA1 family)